MDAIKLLKSDHDKVKGLFEQFENSEGGDHRNLFEKIKTELEVHTHIEETVLYPQMKEFEELKDIVLEGVEEHHQVKLLIREIDNLTEASEKIEPKLKVLIEDVEHHIEEEEGEMFPKIQKLLDSNMLEKLGKELSDEKNKYKSSESFSARK